MFLTTDMKKLVLLASLLFALTYAQAQTSYKIYSLATGHFDPKTSKQDISEYKPVELTFVVTGQTVTINDKEKSVYKLISKSESGENNGTHINIWNALDKKNIPCSFAILKSDTGTTFQIYYAGTSAISSYKVQTLGNYFDYDSMEP